MKAKKVIAAILSGIISFTNTVSGFTSHADEGTATKSVSENSEITVDHENSLGSLFSEEIGKQLEQLQSAGNSITSVEINEKTATVTYNSSIDCMVVVGIYDDSGKTLLGSGTADVLSGKTIASVDIEISVMPEYFYVKAYLVDGLGLAPLCTVYENPNYTLRMTEFFSKTTADFDEKRVLNFDEDTTNNFAVYFEDVILLEETEGYNNVVKCDNENGVYVFENADETLLSLKNGDLLSYDYSDETEMIIVKVDTIIIDGTAVTITAAQTSIEEVFEYVKIDKQTEQSEAEFDTEGISDVIESDFTNLDHSENIEKTIKNGAELTDAYTLQYDDDVDILSDEKYEINTEIEFEIEKGKADILKKDTVKIIFESNEQKEEIKDANVKLKADIFSGSLIYTSTLSLKLYLIQENKKNDSDSGSKKEEFDSEKHS